MSTFGALGPHRTGGSATALWRAAALPALALALVLGGCAPASRDVADTAPGADAVADADVAPDGAGVASTLSVVTLNLLHGLACPGSDRCRLDDRIARLVTLLVEAGCPEVVALQEIASDMAESLAAQAETLCSTPYQVVYLPSDLPFDDELVLTRHPPLGSARLPLYRDVRHALWVRVDHPAGPVDVFTTHLASSSDGGPDPCGSACPPACVDAAAPTVRACQAVQLAAHVAAARAPGRPAVITGDMNFAADDWAYQHLAGLGWVDAYLAAGHPECDPGGGVGCTSGREDASLVELESPAHNQDERIDFIFVSPAAGCPGEVDPATTGPFAAAPAPACGPAPAPVCWPSDHDGVAASIPVCP